MYCKIKIKLLILSLYFFIDLHAQTAVKLEIEKSFKNYQASHCQEKVFVHTDKTLYLAGETIWFSIFSLDGMLHLPSPLSSIAYVELIGTSAENSLKTSIHLQQGNGNGYFTLPSSLETGSYQLTAYSNWMKNKGIQHFFHTSISIINTLKPTGWNTATVNSGKAGIRFFPEGGILVDGIPTKLAFKILDANGKPTRADGCILNAKNDTLASFSSDTNGFGNCHFTAGINEQYHAIVYLNKQFVTSEFPPVLPTGTIMQLNEAEQEGIKVGIVSNDQYRNQQLFLLVQARQKIVSLQEINLVDGKAVFVLDKKLLPPGVSSLTLFNNSKEAIAERLYFNKPLHPFITSVSTEKKLYGAREKVNLSIAFKDAAASIDNASVSVFLADKFQPKPANDIASYCLLTSFLGGEVENPAFYLSEKSNATDAENLLLANGISPFKWEDVMKPQPPKNTFLPEINGHVVQVKLLDKITGKGIAGMQLYASIPGKQFRFSSATSNEDGNAWFNFEESFGNADLVIIPGAGLPSNAVINIIPQFSTAAGLPSTAGRQSIFSAEDEKQLLARSINMQAENSFLFEKKKRFAKLDGYDSSAFFGTTLFKYMLDDYTRFITLEEVFQEYIKDVRIRKTSNSYSLKVKDEIQKEFMEFDPLVLFDGIPVADFGKLMAINPLGIEKIQVGKGRYAIANETFDGLISLHSYEGNMPGLELPSNAVIVSFTGIQQPKLFYQPVFETEEQIKSPLPDFRNVLYWNPSVKAGDGGEKKLSFYSSGFAGNYLVVLQGLTKDGQPFYAETTFTVK